MHEYLHIGVKFCSFVLLPFIAFLRLFRVQVFGALVITWALYLFVGLMIMGGGVTPSDVGAFPRGAPHIPLDVVTDEQRNAWFRSGFVHTVAFLWLLGLGIGIPLLAITWLREHRKMAAWLDVFDDGVVVFTLAVGVWEFSTSLLPL